MGSQKRACSCGYGHVSTSFWCFRRLATFLAPRFGFLLPQMVFYCILLRPARATQRKPSDSQTVIKGIDLGTRVVKCQVRAKRSSRESRVAKWEPKGCPRDPKLSQRISKESQKGDQSGSKNMITRKRRQRRIPKNRKVEKCKKWQMINVVLVGISQAGKITSRKNTHKINEKTLVILVGL